MHTVDAHATALTIFARLTLQTKNNAPAPVLHFVLIQQISFSIRYLVPLPTNELWSRSRMLVILADFVELIHLCCMLVL